MVKARAKNELKTLDDESFQKRVLWVVSLKSLWQSTSRNKFMNHSTNIYCVDQLEPSQETEVTSVM